MKLPALISGGTAAKLEKAKGERDRVEAVIADLRSKLRDLDVSADDYTASALLFAGQIQVHEKAVEVCNVQISGLETILHDEEHRAAMARRAAAIKTVEQMLPARIKIIEEIEAAVKAIPTLFEKLDAWRAKFAKQYPVADVEYPYAHFIDSDRILRNVQAALRTIRAEDVAEIIDGLAADEARHHADLIADLKANSQHITHNHTDSEAA